MLGTQADSVVAEDVSAVEALDLVVSWRLGFTNAVTWQPLGSLTSLGASDQLKQQKNTSKKLCKWFSFG